MEKLCAGSDEQMLQALIDKASRWRLTTPAILMLEITRPFSFIASQGLLLCQPLLGFFGSEAAVTHVAELLADRSNLDRLIDGLETSDRRR